AARRSSPCWSSRGTRTARSTSRRPRTSRDRPTRPDPPPVARRRRGWCHGGMHWQLRMAIGAAGAALLLPAAGAGASAGALDESELRQALLDHMDYPAEWAGDTEEAAAERGIGVPEPAE